MWAWIKAEWDYLYGTFHDSENILWARFNVALASLWAALQSADLSPVFHDPKILTYWIIFSNLVNEWTRRRRAEFNEDGSIK
jgi:hypothetical protein